ncbi:hypothetical protein [Tenacibaculum sp.]|uniref:hypothetical protein n=2 Tax=Pseudomonadati TaxID=3379134 RepID=UPI003AA9CD8B
MKSTFNIIFSCLSFNALASGDGLSLGINTGIYSDSKDGDSDVQHAYSRLLFGYHMNDFGGQVTLTKSDDNELEPYLGIITSYDFNVAKNYLLRPTFGAQFSDGRVEPNIGLELHYLITNSSHFVIRNGYKLSSEPDYLFGLGFEYHFLSSEDDVVPFVESPNESISRKNIETHIPPKCENTDSFRFLIKDLNPENTWTQINIIIDKKFSAKIPIINNVAVFNGSIPIELGDFSISMMGNNKYKNIHTMHKVLASLPNSKCNIYKIETSGEYINVKAD